MPDNIAGKGKMMEERAITVNWVLDGVDCCCVGFLPRTYVVQGEIWDGVLCQVVIFLKKWSLQDATREVAIQQGVCTLCCYLLHTVGHWCSPTEVYQGRGRKEWWEKV